MNTIIALLSIGGIFYVIRLLYRMGNEKGISRMVFFYTRTTALCFIVAIWGGLFLMALRIENGETFNYLKHGYGGRSIVLGVKPFVECLSSGAIFIFGGIFVLGFILKSYCDYEKQKKDLINKNN